MHLVDFGRFFEASPQSPGQPKKTCKTPVDSICYTLIMAIQVHQIFYMDSQKGLLDPSFRPFDNAQAIFPYNYEFGVIYKSSGQQPLTTDELRGFVSWKFGAKTGVDGARFKNFIEANPGYDVYSINPFPGFSFFRSVWQQGDFFHPGMMALAQRAMDNSGYHLNLQQIENDSTDTLYCNFWVGNKKFWQMFMDFSGPLWKYFENEASAEERKMYAAPADNLSNAPYSAYLFERLYSTFMATPKAKAEIRSIIYPYSLAELRRKYSALFAIGIWALLRWDSSWARPLLRPVKPLVTLFLRSRLSRPS